ncbi:hypothetical protein ARMGADRAFT_788824 [Armillaria gallica]|uniref:Uncharacterized protein n=1 Tax=Armillaria gallica TaxID=47427 RepID=A0A2H3DMT5_ARMGA|nr:hypothetical protein ARMGADRAFT_788824 [Armillaria gallica]
MNSRCACVPLIVKTLYQGTRQSSDWSMAALQALPCRTAMWTDSSFTREHDNTEKWLFTKTQGHQLPKVRIVKSMFRSTSRAVPHSSIDLTAHVDLMLLVDCRPTRNIGQFKCLRMYFALVTRTLLTTMESACSLNITIWLEDFNKEPVRPLAPNCNKHHLEFLSAPSKDPNRFGPEAEGLTSTGAFKEHIRAF